MLTINDPVSGINDRDPNDPHELNSVDKTPTATQVTKVEDNSDNAKEPTFSQNMAVLWLETREILINPHFMCATGGLVGLNFCLGGLAEWMGTFLLRYDNVSLDTAGLVVGAATVIGGIGGTVLGSKLSDIIDEKGYKNPYFLIPAVFTIPATILLFIVINISDFGVAVALLLIGEVCMWTYTAPISAISISSIPPRLRSRSCGKFVGHDVVGMS